MKQVHFLLVLAFRLFIYLRSLYFVHLSAWESANLNKVDKRGNDQDRCYRIPHPAQTPKWKERIKLA